MEKTPGLLQMYKNELILEIYKRADTYHTQKMTEWKPYIEALTQSTRVIYNHFYEVVQQYAIALSELDFTPSLKTTDMDSLEQIQQSKKATDHIKKIINKYSQDIQTFLQHGIATNYSVLYLFVKDDTVRFKNVSINDVMIYELPDKTLFVINKITKKVWTDTHIYTIKDDKVTSKYNPMGFIPYLIFQPYLVNKGTESALGYYGRPHWQLMNLQTRYNTNQTSYADYTQGVLKPAIISKMTAQELTPEEYNILIRGGGIVKTNDPINDHVFKTSIATNGLQVLQNNEQKILQEKNASTGISEATLGGTTKDYSTSYFKALRETALRPMKEVESAYIRFYNDLVIKIALLLKATNKDIADIDINNIKLETGQKELDPMLFQNFLNNLLPMIEKFGSTEATVNLFEEVITPIFHDMVAGSGLDQVESVIGLKKSFNALREDVKQQDVIKEQQIILQKEQQELDSLNIKAQKMQIEAQIQQLSNPPPNPLDQKIPG